MAFIQLDGALERTKIGCTNARVMVFMYASPADSCPAMQMSISFVPGVVVVFNAQVFELLSNQHVPSVLELTQKLVMFTWLELMV